jgi:hypothetical protein
MATAVKTGRDFMESSNRPREGGFVSALNQETRERGIRPFKSGMARLSGFELVSALLPDSGQCAFLASPKPLRIKNYRNGTVIAAHREELPV